MPINCTHEVNRLAARLMDEGETSEAIEQAVNEYLMDCDMELPEVQAALFHDDNRPTLLDYAQLTLSRRMNLLQSYALTA